MKQSLENMLSEFDSFVETLKANFQQELTMLLCQDPDNITPKEAKTMTQLLSDLDGLAQSSRPVLQSGYELVKNFSRDNPYLTDLAKDEISKDPDAYLENRIQDNKQNLQDYVNNKIKDLKFFM